MGVEPSSSPGHPAQTPEDVDTDELFALLADADCRSILLATADAPLTAKEVANRCDLAQSTAYRKLARLEEVSLLSESLRFRRTGKHTSQYALAIDELHLSLTQAGATVEVAAASPVMLADGGQ